LIDDEEKLKKKVGFSVSPFSISKNPATVRAKHARTVVFGENGFREKGRKHVFLEREMKNEMGKILLNDHIYIGERQQLPKCPPLKLQDYQNAPEGQNGKKNSQLFLYLV
jgi:hypothetical protein